MKRASFNRRGFFFTDAVTGLAIVVIMTFVLTSAVIHYRRGSDRLADTRQATRLAEQTMLALQAGQPVPTPAEGDSIESAPIEPAKDVSGTTWIRVRTVHNGRAATLTGIVRSESAKGGVP